MKRQGIFNSVYFLTILICACIIIMYSALMKYNFLNNDKTFAYFTNFLLAVFLLYLVYVLTNFLEYIALRLLKLIVIKSFVIYPFVFDRTITFQPIRLLFNQECIRDVFPRNILYDYANGGSLEEIKLKFKKIRYIREGALLVTLLIFTIAITYLLGENINFYVILIYILLFLASFCKANDNWVGNRYVLLENKFEEYVLSSKYCEVILIDNYSKYLQKFNVDEKINDDNRGALLRILENYLYACIYEKKVTLDKWTIRKILYCIGEENNKENTLYTLKMSQVKKLIGLVGKKNDNEEYCDYGVDLMSEEIAKINQNNAYGIGNMGIKHLREYQDFLLGKKETVNYKGYFVSGIESVFSSSITVDNEIRMYCQGRDNLGEVKWRK